MRRSVARWVVALALVSVPGSSVAGCGGAPADLATGEPCVRSAQCQPGLVCNMGMCSADLTGFGEGVVPSADAGIQVDAGEELDAGPEVDAGPPIDAGPPPDAGPPVDAGSTPDAGPPDAGPPDAGPPDAGPPDAGPPEMDAGTPEPDAGAEEDAGA